MGPRKLPELGRGLGQGIRGLRDALAGAHGGKKDEEDVKRLKGADEDVHLENAIDCPP
jgi:Sec-independent protein translocase protein TatA